MDAGSLTAPQPAPSWRLADSVAAATQGLIVTGFGQLPTGRALFLEFTWPGDSGPEGWLNRLQTLAPVTSAVRPDSKSQARAASMAFSSMGLKRMGLAEVALASFARSFQEGMFQEDRLRRLGDRREGEWLSTVVDGGPVWSANTPLRSPTPSTPSGFDVPPVAPAEQHIPTRITVHALLLLYAQDEAAADAWADRVQTQLAQDGVAVVRCLELLLDIENAGFSREHFGFADGLSQPLPYDEGKAVLVGDQPAKQDLVQGVPLGEFMFGHINGHHEMAPGPVVADNAVGPTTGLRASENAEGFLDLGLNGSYLVVRELKQDVAAFWRSMEASAASIRAQDPQRTQHVTAPWLAERVVGRDRDGHLLCPGNATLPACADRSPDSSFRFFDRDSQATGCPPGSHVRRAFPRDALAPNSANRDTLLQAANNHRVLRRGRKFGTKLADLTQDDGADRGLLFMCLNTDIGRQFEFVQQTWLLNSSFATLFQELDPLVGPAGPMTIRDEPLRRTVSLETFVRMAGGDYFFLPSVPALQFLASL
jgi:deferrochelatase/peroxidase EfeB